MSGATKLGLVTNTSLTDNGLLRGNGDNQLVQSSTNWLLDDSDILNVSLAGVTDTGGVLDMDITTGTANVVGIDLLATLTADVDGLNGISSSIVGFSSGGGSGNVSAAFAASLSGTASDTDHSYEAFSAADASKNGGTSEMSVFVGGTGYDFLLLAASGDVNFDAYSPTFARSDESNVTASTEANAILFGEGGGSRTWATGALATQREFSFLAQQYAFVGASTITDAANVYINGAPSEGANCTITNAYALWIDDGLVRSDGAHVWTPDAITATSDGVAASVDTPTTNITTNGDSDLDNVTLAAGKGGQIKVFAVTAVGNAADSVKITPASMIGGTQITFPANPLGLGCIMEYDAAAAGWIVVSNNGGTIS